MLPSKIPPAAVPALRLRLASRRRFLRRLGGGAALLTGATGAYAALVEPFWPVVERVTIPLAGLPPAFNGLRIAQLSDLHIQPGFPASWLVPALDQVRREQPDLIVLTGDYINNRQPDQEKHTSECVRALAGLRAPLGVWAIFGNHDYPPPPADPSPGEWQKAGIHTLSDQAIPLHRKGAQIWLVGLRSMTQRPVNPGQVLRLAPPRAVKIVLWHEPDRAAETAQAGGALQLSGHTHGGQIVLPGIGPPMLPIGGRLYPAGLYQVAGMPLYVSRGVGLLPPRVRLNCPPEVTILTLTRRA